METLKIRANNGATTSLESFKSLIWMLSGPVDLDELRAVARTLIGGGGIFIYSGYARLTSRINCSNS